MTAKPSEIMIIATLSRSWLEFYAALELSSDELIFSISDGANMDGQSKEPLMREDQLNSLRSELAGIQTELQGIYNRAPKENGEPKPAGADAQRAVVLENREREIGDTLRNLH